MSRIIVSRHSDGSEHVTIGWDHPAGGAFWQEHGSLEEIARAQAWMEDNGDVRELYDTPEYRLYEVLADTGLKRDAGMWPGIPLHKLRDTMPEELRPLLTERVFDLLVEHAGDPESGRMRPIDLTKE